MNAQAQGHGASIKALWDDLRAGGLGPETAEAASRELGKLQPVGLPPSVRMVRDVAYGDHPRHRLDIGAPSTTVRAAPILLFVHGGGFVSGDKRDGPFFDNIAIWAATNGFVSIAMNYRLAPEHRWPAGAEDISRAIAWIHDHREAHGGDVGRIVLMGHSAGATHVSGYIAHRRFHPGKTHGLAGAIVVSGTYDLTLHDRRRAIAPYFGDDAAYYAERSAMPRIEESDLPILVAVSEYDPQVLREQSEALFRALSGRNGARSAFATIAGHNHYSSVMAINTALGQQLEEEMLRFMSSLS